MSREYIDFEIGEKIALAITHMMRDDFVYFRGLMVELREEGWSDEKIGDAFMEVGRIVFAEEESKQIGDEE
jgi:hypothetical protein